MHGRSSAGRLQARHVTPLDAGSVRQALVAAGAHPETFTDDGRIDGAAIPVGNLACYPVRAWSSSHIAARDDLPVTAFECCLGGRSTGSCSRHIGPGSRASPHSPTSARSSPGPRTRRRRARPSGGWSRA